MTLTLIVSGLSIGVCIDAAKEVDFLIFFVPPLDL